MNIFGWFKKAPEENQEPDYTPSVKQKRHYNAINKERLLAGWERAPVNINQVIREELTKLRARSREQARNNDYVRQYIRTLQNNVVGSIGVTIQSQVVRADNHKSLDIAANKAIESAYKDYGLAVDITGRLTRNTNLRILLAALVTDGEYIAIQHSGVKFGKYGYQIEVVDPELLDVTRNVTLKNGNQVRLGIEYNKSNKPVYYWFKKYKPELGGYSNHEWSKVQASRVLHAYYHEHVGQERGIPWLATSLFTLKTLDAYDEAAVTAARVGASKMGFFSSDDGTEYTGEELNTEANDGSTVMEAEAGVFENIGNLQFKEFNPQYPHEQYPHFKKAGIRRFASGLGAQYETLANDRENVNYTSIRHGTLEDRETWKTIQEFLINAFVRPDREQWLKMALTVGAIKIGRTPLSRAYTDYLPARYQPRRWDWVDPSKDMDAKAKEHELRTKSVSEIIMESGRDPDDVFNQIAADKQKMKDLGILESEVLDNAEQTN